MTTPTTAPQPPPSAAQVLAALRTRIDAEKAKVLPRFFRTGPGEYGEGDRFLGVIVPEQRQVARVFASLPLAELTLLLASPYHEARHTALLILVRKFTGARGEQREPLVGFYLEHLEAVNNWDLVDLSAPKILGAWLLQRPAAERSVLYELANSNELWRQRVAMLATMPLIKAGDFTDALQLAEQYLPHHHDLMHKAAGWMLREIGNRDRDVELAFLRRTYHDMPRTMLRYAIEKFPPDLRQKFLQGTA